MTTAIATEAPSTESQATQLQRAIPTEVWAPPFNKQPYLWTRFRSPTPAGSWTAVVTSWNGQIVSQLGARPAVPNPPLTRCELLTAFVRSFTIPAGAHNWFATFRTGPISKLARGGHVDVYAFLQVRGPGFHSLDLRPVVSNSNYGLLVGSSQNNGQVLQAGRYEIRVGSLNYLDYKGSALPYTEFIGNVTSLLHFGAGSSRSLEHPPVAERVLERLSDDSDLLQQTPPEGVDASELLAFEEG